MDVDLSEQLRVRKKSGDEASTSAAPGAAPPRRRPPVKYGSIPPTRVEQRNWERSGKYSKKVVATAPTNEVDQVGLAGGAACLEVGAGAALGLGCRRVLRATRPTLGLGATGSVAQQGGRWPAAARLQAGGASSASPGDALCGLLGITANHVRLRARWHLCLRHRANRRVGGAPRSSPGRRLA